MLFQFHRSTVAAAVMAAFALPAVAQDAATLPTVTVAAKGEGDLASTGALGSKPLLDTPFSVSVATEQDIANQQATSIADAFKADAAVTESGNNIARENSMITIRGLQIDMLNGFKVDGLNVAMWNADLPLEHFERIELLKGLSGFMYGFAQPGGIASYTTKRAGKAPVTALTAGYGTESQYKLSADVGRRFGGDRFGLRVNAVREGGDTYIDAPIRRDSASLAFDAWLTDSLSWNIDTLYQKRKVNGSMFAMALGDSSLALPAPIDGSRRLTHDFTYHQTELMSVGTGLKWALNADWSLRAGARTSELQRTNYNSYLSIDDAAGNYSNSLAPWYSVHDSESANLILEGKLTTGVIRHELVVGADVQHVSRSSGEFNWGSLPGGNLASGPQPGTDPNTQIPTALSKDFHTRNTGVFVSDTIAWSPSFSTIIGLRHSDYRTRNYSGAGTTYDKTAVTPTLAAIWKPAAGTSVYASFVEALEEGSSAPTGSVNENQVFSPLKSRQLELGAKRQAGIWSAEAALFRVERGLAYTNSANVFVQEGGLVFHGLDLAGRVELGRDWALRASTVLMRSENQSDDASVNGKDAANTPGFSASLQAEYRVPVLPGLTLLAGARHVGKRYLEADNSHRLDSYQLYDLGARYQTRLGNQQVTLRANLDNATDEKYWQANQWAWLTPGAPRTFRVSAEFKF